MERWLHRLVLESAAVRRLSFDLETFVLARPAQLARGQPVYLCGLARSGTTLLLRLLNQSGEFASLSFRDMPFVMSPNLWARLSGPWQRHAQGRERIHGDDVLVDFDSPEAFEEVFWRTFDSRLEQDLECYGAATPDEVALREFARYRCLVEAVVRGGLVKPSAGDISRRTTTTSCDCRLFAASRTPRCWCCSENRSRRHDLSSACMSGLALTQTTSRGTT